MTGLSKNLKESLKYLASQPEVRSLLGQLAERVELHKTCNSDEPIVLDLEPEDPMEWMEGVESLQKMTEDDLYKILGFDDRKIPFLVTEIDADTDIGAQALDNEDATEIAPTSQGVEMQPFALRWHQLVGLTKMVQCAMTSQAVLLMDDVGLGKTLQVIAFFAVMTYYRQFHSETKKYPGAWGEC
jgi:SNF2 family DNA or RNA helicase